MTPSAQQLITDKPEVVKELIFDFSCFLHEIKGTNIYDNHISDFILKHSAKKEYEILERSQQVYKLNEPVKVKRLSDGSIWEVRQKTMQGIIIGFHVEGNILYARTDQNLQYPLSKLQPVDVFKDEEGNVISIPNTKFYSVYESELNDQRLFSYGTSIDSLNDQRKNEGVKFFLYRESAENYLAQTGKYFSVEDIKELRKSYDGNELLELL